MIRDVLELAILGLLKERPMHGYELRKRLRDELGAFSNVSFGSLYPALSRLQRAGAVEALSAADELDADEPSTRATARAAAALGGRGTRARKVYVLTERGEVLFGELLEATDVVDDPRSFLLKLSFARHLSPASRLRLLDRRRLQLLDRVERAARLLGSRRRDIDRYGLALLEHAFSLAQADLDWVERLLAAEQQSLTGEADEVAVPGGEQVALDRAAVTVAPRVSPDPPTGTAAAISGGATNGSAASAGIAGILHAGRLRRRAEQGPRSTTHDLAEPAEQELVTASRNRARKEQVRR